MRASPHGSGSGSHPRGKVSVVPTPVGVARRGSCPAYVEAVVVPTPVGVARNSEFYPCNLTEVVPTPVGVP
jgi:hypothetical protein